MTILITILLILLAAIGAAASVREIFYVKALSRPEDMSRNIGRILSHFALAVLAVLVLFAPEDRLPFPHFVVYIISYIFGYYSQRWAFLNAALLLYARYDEYSCWISELIRYENEPLYKLSDLPPEPELPDDMNLPLHSDWIEPTFDTYWEERSYYKKEEIDKALRRRKEQLEDRERKNKKK